MQALDGHSRPGEAAYPPENRVELDRRQERLQKITAVNDEAERIRLAEEVRLSEQRLLKQKIPEWLERALLDEHVGLLNYLADHLEFTRPERTARYRQEAFPPRNSLWLSPCWNRL